jgi:hypothetical protein
MTPVDEARELVRTERALLRRRNGHCANAPTRGAGWGTNGSQRPGRTSGARGRCRFCPAGLATGSAGDVLAQPGRLAGRQSSLTMFPPSPCVRGQST